MKKGKLSLVKLEKEIAGLKQDWELNNSITSMKVLGDLISQLPLLLHLHKGEAKTSETAAILIAEGGEKGKEKEGLRLIASRLVNLIPNRQKQVDVQGRLLLVLTLSLFLLAPDGKSGATENFFTAYCAVESGLVAALGRELLRPVLEEERERELFVNMAEPLAIFSFLLANLSDGGFDTKSAERTFRTFAPRIKEKIEKVVAEVKSSGALARGEVESLLKIAFLSLEKGDFEGFLGCAEKAIALCGTSLAAVKVGLAEQRSTITQLEEGFFQQSNEIQQLKAVFSQSA